MSNKLREGCRVRVRVTEEEGAVQSASGSSYFDYLVDLDGYGTVPFKSNELEVIG